MESSRPQKPAGAPDLGETVVPSAQPRKPNAPGPPAAAPGATHATPGSTQAASGQPAAKHGASAAKPGASPSKPGVAPQKPGAAPPKPGGGPAAQGKPAAAPSKPAATQANLGATFVPPKQPAAAANLDATCVAPDDSAVAGGNLEATRPEGAAAGSPARSGTNVPLTQLGDFKIVKKLGQGGMGEVFLAHQVSLDRHVALKVMATQFSSQETFVKRFKREAQTMAKLDHPHIVRGYAVGEDQGRLYLAMELVNGKSMQNWLEQLGTLSVGDALYVTLHVADALKHAHEINLIHRDIKPDNILVTDKGVVKVSDMGLAKATDEDMSMTQSGTGLGTPYYMPPEQARNAKHVDHRSDIYALGCTLYHFLSGKLPFAGNSATELILAKEKGTFTRVRSVNSKIPERLELVLDKMLAKDPKHRYQSCEELIRDLNNLGTAHDSLSFIQSAASSSTKLPRPAGQATTPAGAKPAAPAGKQAAAPKDDAVLFVYQFGPDKKPKKVKLTIAQIKQQLKSGALDTTSKACATADGSYRPLASFREFDQVVQERLVKADAKKKSEQYQQLYKKIDRQAAWYPYVKWFKRRMEDVRGIVSLILYLGMLIAIGYGLIAYGPTLIALIRAKAGGG